MEREGYMVDGIQDGLVLREVQIAMHRWAIMFGEGDGILTADYQHRAPKVGFMQAGRDGIPDVLLFIANQVYPGGTIRVLRQGTESGFSRVKATYIQDRVKPLEVQPWSGMGDGQCICLSMQVQL
jgi:hypothetical protein